MWPKDVICFCWSQLTRAWGYLKEIRGDGTTSGNNVCLNKWNASRENGIILVPGMYEASSRETFDCSNLACWKSNNNFTLVNTGKKRKRKEKTYYLYPVLRMCTTLTEIYMYETFSPGAKTNVKIARYGHKEFYGVRMQLNTAPGNHLRSQVSKMETCSNCRGGVVK